MDWMTEGCSTGLTRNRLAHKNGFSTAMPRLVLQVTIGVMPLSTAGLVVMEP